MSFAIIDAAPRTESPGHVGRSRYTTPIANLPVICHVLDELAMAGIDRARLIVAPAEHSQLERVVGSRPRSGVDVSYATAGESDSRMTALRELERIVADEPVVVQSGDCLYPGQISSMWDRFRAGDVDAVVLRAGDDARPRSRSSAGGFSSRLTSAPVIVGSAGSTLIAGLLSGGANRDLAGSLLSSNCRIAVCELGGHWCYSDDAEHLLAANRLMLDVLRVPALEGAFGDDNIVRGRVAISSSARVSGSVLHGPVSVDGGAVVEDSFVGPYSAIGEGAILSGAEIYDTMVLAGAEISHPGQRIAGSIICEGASVVRTFALPRGLHLWLPPHSRVTLS